MTNCQSVFTELCCKANPIISTLQYKEFLKVVLFLYKFYFNKGNTYNTY